MPRLMTHPISAAMAILVAMALSGCSSFPFSDNLKPNVPPAARTSFVSAVKTAAGENPVTLDIVKASFDSLYAGVRAESDSKDKQDWSYKEATATGGGAAALGQLASKAGLLNTGLAVAMVGLSMDSFYKPATTKATHLKAEDMFQCLQKEFFFVSEADRKIAVGATTGGADKAATAIRDSIEQVDSAITRYRLAVLAQGPSMPTNDDFSRFAKQYAKDAVQAEQVTTNSANQLAQATKVHGFALAKAGTKTLQKTEGVVAKTDLEMKTDLDSLEQAAAALRQAEANAAGAKFIALATNLEACVKKFTP